MKVLSLDTSSNLGSLALLENENLLMEISWEEASSHTALLPIQFQEILKQTKTTLEDIDLFAVAKGPGSFTGIRIGMAFMKGLTLLNEKPVFGVSTLEAMANTVEGESWICPLIDARRSQIFGALYQQEEKQKVLQIEEQAEFPLLFLKKLKKLPLLDEDSLIFLGSGAQKYEKEIQGEFGDSAKRISKKIPLASWVAHLAFQAVQQNVVFRASLDLLPHYLRSSAAEISNS